ncbi:variable large family protein [Borrelia turicatae]|uniref:variable large family protein n=1 Tax=Borrelia turicatae TaxID=142 RepID=UPI002ED4D0D1
MKNKLIERIKNFNITILITLFLLLSCGSGQQPQAGNGGSAATGGRSLSEVLMDVSRSAENAFYSFLELLSDTLGLRVTKDTTKQQIGDYFKSLGDKLGQASDELEEVAKKSETDVDKGGLNKVIRSAVDTAKTTLNTLKTLLNSLKDIGDGEKVGDATSNQNGVAAAEDELKVAYKALQEIVKAAKEKGVPEPELGDTAVKVGNGTDNKDGAKILGTNAAATAGDSGKAAAILTTVSGEEILASIVVSKDADVAGVTGQANAQTSAVAFAKGGQADHVSHSADAKAAAVAGGIALRSLVKGGKLAAAAAGNAGGQEEVQKVGITAANKLLVAVEDIIKKTVKNVLKTTKEKIDEARAPKPADQQ